MANVRNDESIIIPPVYNLAIHTLCLAVLFSQSEFLFHKDSQYNGELKYCEVYINYGVVCLKIDYTLRSLYYIFLGLLIIKTLTNVL